jgi:tRNA(Ile)-lysidine synthase
MPATALRDAVKRDGDQDATGRPVLAGVSGGLDSSVLLHLLAHDPATRRHGLRAVHVHHGLHADADAWAAHCGRACEALGVPLQVVHVEVARDTGLGVEGAARAARHAAFAAALQEGEILALAHHRDDQAETFLLRALRGSGVDGLAAMRRWRAHGRGWLWRPLLDHPRQALQAYADAHGLRWIDDPSNADAGLDRNFLRTRMMPLLRERWPHASDSFARAAALAAQAADLLATEDAAALAAALRDERRLDVAALQALPGERRARVLRRWIQALGLPPLPASGIAGIDADLLAVGDMAGDGDACFEWSGARVRRWRHLLHAGMIQPPLSPDWSHAWDGASPIVLPTGDQLALVGAARFEAPLRVHARQGGERLRLPGRDHSHALKHVLQDAGIPPWQRARMPLLSSADGELLAAGDAVLSARLDAWLRAHHARLQWTSVA